MAPRHKVQRLLFLQRAQHVLNGAVGNVQTRGDAGDRFHPIAHIHPKQFTGDVIQNMGGLFDAALH